MVLHSDPISVFLWLALLLRSLKIGYIFCLPPADVNGTYEHSGVATGTLDSEDYLR